MSSSQFSSMTVEFQKKKLTWRPQDFKPWSPIAERHSTSLNFSGWLDPGAFRWCQNWKASQKWEDCPMMPNDSSDLCRWTGYGPCRWCSEEACLVIARSKARLLAYKASNVPKHPVLRRWILYRECYGSKSDPRTCSRVGGLGWTGSLWSFRIWLFDRYHSTPQRHGLVFGTGWGPRDIQLSAWSQWEEEGFSRTENKQKIYKRRGLTQGDSWRDFNWELELVRSCRWPEA